MESKCRKKGDANVEAEMEGLRKKGLVAEQGIRSIVPCFRHNKTLMRWRRGICGTKHLAYMATQYAKRSVFTGWLSEQHSLQDRLMV